ncbi:WbuC family cupin fold metalloprotein [Desulfonatronovibrio magnus]|uniref:WbuC family cupin fold metalloprotein n=1 Tax=Desulfonatronovibrio magnus TaxID=698827 RepID=UPI0005EBED00|nr:WbuC family cupin fold metalloprotein [Desulfonatronovibrio magnus]
MIELVSSNNQSSEVYHAQSSSSKISKLDIDILISKADDNEQKRSRYCVHESIDETVHEMVIVHSKGMYVRPHKHIEKSESMLVLDGLVDYYTFDDHGNVVSVEKMAGYSSRHCFYISNRNSAYHSIIILSDWLVFLEITQGPFAKSDTMFAPWAPDESNHVEIEKFLKKIMRFS